MKSFAREWRSTSGNGMRAVDTNVLVRLVTGDTQEQAEIAERFVEPGAWVPLAAVLECAWVLRANYGFSDADLGKTLAMLLENDRLVFQDDEVIRAAVRTFRDKPVVQFADALMLESARRAGHLPLGTFDKKLASRPGTVRL